MRNFLDEWGTALGVLLMILFSATAAYIKEFEKANADWSRGRHARTLFFKLIYSGFCGLLVWYGAQSLIKYGIKVPEPVIPVITGIAGYSGAQFIDFAATNLMDLISAGVDWCRKRLGLEPRKQNP